MKRLSRPGAIVALLVLAALLGLEIAARTGGRTTLLGPKQVFEPERRGDCAGAWLETDATGERRTASVAAAPPAATAPRRIVVVGGGFTAGAGLEAGELYSARLAPPVRPGGYGAVAACAVREGKAARALEEVARLGAQDLLVLEIDGADLGGDPEPFEIAAPAGHALPEVSPAASALVTWLRLAARRRDRARAEAEIADLVARDGFTGRASARSKLRLEALTSAVERRQLDGAQSGLLRAWLDELHGLRRNEERTLRFAEWRQLFEALRRAHRFGVLVVTGPTPTTLGLVQAARDFGLAIVHAAPFELDPELVLAVPWRRPAAVVHAQVADSTWAALTRHGLLHGAAAAPPEVREAADAIEGQVLSRGGFDESTISLARGLVGESLQFAARPAGAAPKGGALPVNALHGVGAGGRIEPGVPAEIVLRRPSFPTGISVRADVAAGARPRLRLRYALGLASESVVADATLVSASAPAAGRPARELVEWSFASPPAKSPIDHPALEFTLLPAAGSDGGAGAAPEPACSREPVELRDVRFLK